MFEVELREFGLTENESQVYVTLLRNGTSSPAIIAGKLGLHRSYVYDILERLQEKEIVSCVVIDSKKQYQANEPAQLAELLKQRLEVFSAAVPKLSRIVNLDATRSLVELHKGTRAFRTALLDVIAHARNETIYLTGVDEDLLEGLEPIYLKRYFNALKEKNILEHVIVKRQSKRFSQPHTVYREIADAYVGNTVQIIYADRVAIFIAGNPNQLILIRDKTVADTYRKQFELLWKNAK